MSLEQAAQGRDYIWVERSLKSMALDVCHRHKISLAGLRGAARTRPIAWPRQEFMWEAYQTGRYSLGQIGLYLGDRDHTTILHGVRAHAARVCGESLD